MSDLTDEVEGAMNSSQDLFDDDSMQDQDQSPPQSYETSIVRENGHSDLPVPTTTTSMFSKSTNSYSDSVHPNEIENFREGKSLTPLKQKKKRQKCENQDNSIILIPDDDVINNESIKEGRLNIDQQLHDDISEFKDCDKADQLEVVGNVNKNNDTKGKGIDKSGPPHHEIQELDLFTCPFCHESETSVELLEEHIESNHSEPSAGNSGSDWSAGGPQWMCPFCDMDLESQSGLETHLSSFHQDECSNEPSLCCPLCGLTCDSVEVMQEHIRVHEAEPTFYSVGVDNSKAGPTVPEMSCPMCNKTFPDSDLLTSHVESHFSPQHCPGASVLEAEQRAVVSSNKENIPVRSSSSSSGSVDHAGPSQSVKVQGTEEPSLYSTGASNYKRQYEKSLEKAVMQGKLSVADFHEQRVMKASDLRGVDNGHSCVEGLIEQLSRLYRQQSRSGQRAYLCSPTAHFSGSYGDRGWGCGYRNFQMMLSCLATQPEYAQKIFKGGHHQIPSIPKVQQLIEAAWGNGFDREGCHQLRGRVANTQKWIGATEIVATLSYLGVRCCLADFHAPSAPDGTHPRLLEWVTDYFTIRRQHFTPPLYLQHQGHSRTIVGVEIDRDITRLLLFDPSSKKDDLAALARGGLSWKNLRTFRRTKAAFKAPQYQIVAVDGLLSDQEYQESKIIKSDRIS